MRKLSFLLLCLAAVCSCNLKGSYYVENCQDFVTRDEGSLINDYGVIYNVSDVASDKVVVPAVDGLRYFLSFDILNSNYDIRLKNTIEVSTLQALPATDPAPTAHDPVSIVLYNISPTWLNLGIRYYKGKESTYLHGFSAQYVHEPATDEITITLYHNGNDENPASADAETLEQVTQLLSIPLTGYGWTPAGVNITCHVLQKKSDGTYEVVQTTYTSNN
ncbi:MAG: hypothetical protein IK008_02710 [Bacteroidales bacterium]|nr:hypothetical protein [Bacteroidales bacterium]